LLQLEILRKLDKKYLGSFEMLCLRGMEKISWTYYVKKRRSVINIQGGKEDPTYGNTKEH
jgi:hypothetical protein